MRPILTVPPRKTPRPFDAARDNGRGERRRGRSRRAPGMGTISRSWRTADPGNNGLGHQSRESPSQASVQTAKDIPPVTAVENAKGDDAAHTHGAAAKDSSTIDTAGTAVAHTDSSGSQGAAAGDMSDQFHFANTNPGHISVHGITEPRRRATGWGNSSVDHRQQRHRPRGTISTLPRCQMQSRTPREAIWPKFAVPPRKTCQRPMSPARRSSGITTPRASKVRFLGK